MTPDRKPIFRRGLKGLALQQARENEFNVLVDDFGLLEIRQDPRGNFFYFYDTKDHHLIKSFLLREGPRVDTLCDVVLTAKDDGYVPRLTFRKRDKTKLDLSDHTEEGERPKSDVFVVKSRVDVGECHEAYWTLIHFLQTFRGVVLPPQDFRVTSGEQLELARALEGKEKTAVLSAVRAALGAELTEQDVEMLLDRRNALAEFDRFLRDGDFFESERARLGTTREGLWQAFFEKHSWIFGYGLTLVACEKYGDDKLERMTTGRDLFTGAGKRADAAMRTKGFLQTLLFAEIKRHDTPLLMPSPYREPDVYQASKELSGAVSQVQKTAHKAVKKLEDLHRQSYPGGGYGFEVSTVRPRQIVIVGQLSQLADDEHINLEKMTSFELWRKGQLGTDVLTFDELYERARYIVESQENSAEFPSGTASS